MNPALLFLLRRSAVNAVKAKVRRLKSPRYLIPTILGAAYFFLVFGQGEIFDRHREFRPPPDPGVHVVMEWGITAVILLMASLSWILPSRGAPLAFLEPEVAQLFPAPVTRKDLVRYKILDLQRYFVLMPLILGLFNIHRFGVMRAGFIGVGAWMSFNALALHGIGAKMTRLSMAENGWSGVRRGLLSFGVIGALVVFVGLSMPALPPFAGLDHLKDDAVAWLHRLGESPAGWALYPFRILVRPFFAADLAEFALRTGGLAVLVGLLYFWVMRCDVSFEEAAAAQAETLTRRIEAARKGKFASAEPGKAVRKSPFPLSPSGPPETAFAWKSVAEMLRGISPRLLVFVFMAFVIAIPISLDRMKDKGDAGMAVLAAVAAGSAMLAGMLVFMGPTMVGVNLRQDMERVEVLKTFPLSGARIVRCSLAGTLLPIAALQGLLVLVAVLCAPATEKMPITPAWRLAAAVLGFAGLPAVTAVSAAVDAALVLYFPSWVKPGQPVAQGGMEGMGYGMLAAIVKVVALALGLLAAAPGILLGALGAAWGPPLLAPAFAVAGGILGAVGIAVEVWLFTLLLGRRFEAFDPAEEGLVA